MKIINKHPLNVEGKFWINQTNCVACGVCSDEAPQNIKYDIQSNSSYVFKQPSNDGELKAVNFAIDACCVAAIIEDY